MTDCVHVDVHLEPDDDLAARARGRRRAPASRRHRRRCRRSGSTTTAAASSSTRSPASPSTTRPAPSGRSSPRAPATSPRAPAPTRSSSSARARRRRPGCCSTRSPTPARCAGSSVRRERGRRSATRRPPIAASTTASTCTPSSATSSTTRPDPARRPAGGRVPRQHDRQPRAGAARQVPGRASPSGLAPGDALLLGTDLVKDVDRLVAAYDDAAGVTAEFNRNVLRVLNRELDADFDVDAFAHVACWDPTRSGSRCDCEPTRRAAVDDRAARAEVDFAARRGDAHRDQRQVPARGRRVELAAAGLELTEWWTDPAGDFALSLSSPR